MTALEIYDELRTAHAIIKGIYKRGQIGDARLESAVDTVDGVLYLAEGEAVRAQQRSDEDSAGHAGLQGELAPSAPKSAPES